MEIKGILLELSSQKGDKTENSNHLVAKKCIGEPQFIDEIASGLGFLNDKKLLSDCVEVFTMISENNPELIISHANRVTALMNSKENKIRWEAMHTLANIAEKKPGVIFSVLAELNEIIEKDKSIIVRDYASDAVANFAKTSIEAAQASYPILKNTLLFWQERHGKQAIKGLLNVYLKIPSLRNEILKLVQPFIYAEKGSVVKEAKKAVKLLN